MRFKKTIYLSEEQEKYLIKKYKNTKNDILMEKLGLKFSTFHRIVRKLGLKKSKQFMKKTQKEGSDKARVYWIDIRENNKEKWDEMQEIRRRNIRWDDPSKHFGFKKGESNKTRMTPKRFKAAIAKTHATLKKMREEELRRVRLGKEPLTRLHSGIVKMTDRDRLGVYKVRSYMVRKYGYIVKNDYIRRIYYDDNTTRNLDAELRYAERHKIRFLPDEEAQTRNPVIVTPDWTDKQGGFQVE